MKNLFNILDIYILLWIIYFLQATLLPGLEIISKCILIVNLLISIYYFIYANIKFKLPPFFHGLNAFLSILVLYGVIYILSGEVIVTPSGRVLSNFAYTKENLISILPIYVFYVFSKRGYLTQRKLISWGYIFIFVCIVTFIQTKTQLINLGFDEGEITNNSGYLFCSLLPFVPFYKKESHRCVFLLFVYLFILAGMKRGAILIGTISLLVYLFSLIKTTSGSRRFKSILLVCIVLILALGFICFFLSTNEYFVQRLEATREGDSSGRDSLYSFFIDHFLYHATEFQQLFGLGANGTMKIYYNFAHCDWLELLTNQGLLGVFFYFIYWVCFIRTIHYGRKNIPVHLSLILFFIVYFLSSIFSMSYMEMPLYSSVAIGYCLAHLNK